ITQSQAVACIDHHVSVGSLPGGPRLVAPEAAATAELVFDFASALQWPLCPEAARALYVGILTDTGGFRFANTTPRVLRVAGALLEHGVDPETIYESVYARDRKSTRLNSSHLVISYAVFCLKKKTNIKYK